jgi:hypothetical protein
VNLYAPDSTQLCVGTLAREPLERFGWLVSLLATAIAALLLYLWWKSRQIDLAGDLAVLDGAGSRSLSSSPISGGSPSWFNVSDRGKVESGKAEDGKNWRLRWRGGKNVSLESAEGEVGDWSEGEVKSERGRGFIEFKRVPLLGGPETNTIRYTPEEGTKMGELVNEEEESE